MSSKIICDFTHQDHQCENIADWTLEVLSLKGNTISTERCVDACDNHLVALVRDTATFVKDEMSLPEGQSFHSIRLT